MAARKKDEQPVPGPGLIVLCWRFLNTFLVILILLYIAARVAISTDGLKGLVREKLEEGTGLDVTIDKVASNWRFDLTLHAVAGRTTNEQSSAGFDVETVRLSWDAGKSLADRKPRLRALVGDKGRLVFERSGDAWLPEGLAGVGDWVGSWLELPVGVQSNAGPGLITADSTWAATTLVISNIDVRWAVSTNSVGDVRGLSVESTPMSASRRYLRHVQLEAVYAEAQGVQVRNADIEWIDAGDTNVVLRRVESR